MKFNLFAILVSLLLSCGPQKKTITLRINPALPGNKSIQADEKLSLQSRCLQNNIFISYSIDGADSGIVPLAISSNLFDPPASSSIPIGTDDFINAASFGLVEPIELEVFAGEEITISINGELVATDIELDGECQKFASWIDQAGSSIFYNSYAVAGSVTLTPNKSGDLDIPVYVANFFNPVFTNPIGEIYFAAINVNTFSCPGPGTNMCNSCFTYDGMPSGSLGLCYGELANVPQIVLPRKFPLTSTMQSIDQSSVAPWPVNFSNEAGVCLNADGSDPELTALTVNSNFIISGGDCN